MVPPHTSTRLYPFILPGLLFAVFLLVSSPLVAQQQRSAAAPLRNESKLEADLDSPRAEPISTPGVSRDRLFYALPNFLTVESRRKLRSDSGREQFNFSEILGSALAAGISTYSYHPAEDRHLRHAVSGWGTQVGFHTFTIVMREFWPDLRRTISRKPPRENSAQ